MNKLPDQQCHATPDEVAELYKKSLTNFLMLDKIPQFNLKGDKLTQKFTVCISPSKVKSTGKCAFHNEDGSCQLIKTGTVLSGCQLDQDENKLKKSYRMRSKEWIEARGAACIKFFAQMMNVV